MNDTMNFNNSLLHNIEDQVLVNDGHPVTVEAQRFIIWQLAMKWKTLKALQQVVKFAFELFSGLGFFSRR